MVSVGVYLFFGKFQKVRVVLTVIIIAITLADLLRFAYKFIPFTDSSLLYPQAGVLSYAQQKTADYPWRVLGVDYVAHQKRILPPNLLMHYHLYSPDTYNPLLLSTYEQFAEASEWGLVNTTVPLNKTIIYNNYDSRLIDLLGVRYIVAISDISSPTWKLKKQMGESRVYENTEALPRAFMIYQLKNYPHEQQVLSALLNKKNDLSKLAYTSDSFTFKSEKSAKNSIQFTQYGDNQVKLTVQTDKKGLLVLTDVYYPTWRVYVDGKESRIYKVDYAFRGVVVPIGKHAVIFKDALF